MDGGKFQRYVWVKGERKRRANREKYEATRKRFLENEVDDIESPKKARVVWPGEFENQLKKRDRNLAKIERRGSGTNTPAIHTPSDSQSIISEELHDIEELSDSSLKEEDIEETQKPVEKKDKETKKKCDISESYTHYSDEFLDSPKTLNASSTATSFFLVSSNLVNE